MAEQNNLTLSLVANFDDLVRRSTPYDPSLADFSIEMVKLIDQLNDQLNYAQNEVKTYRDKLNQLEMENRQLDANLKNTREAYKKEVAMRASICRERDNNHGMRTKIDEVTFSSDCLSDNDFDKSEDDLDEPAKKQRGEIKFASNQNLVPPVVSTNTNNAPIQSRVDLSKFMSNPTLTPINENVPRPIPTMNSQSKSRIDTRAHSFVQKKLLRSNETCTVCSGKFGFYSNYYRCNDCRACAHLYCKSKLPVPCVPYATSNQVGKKGRLITIADFVNPIARPCIPALIIHCCRELEKRGLTEVGLYRIPGSDLEIKSMVDKFFRSKSGVPVLSNLDVHVLTGMIKNFLNRLDEPLVTRVLWKDFVDAAKIDNLEDRIPYIVTAISELPLANKHTLAYLMLHFQRVIASPLCCMAQSNIARILGPTIIGFSSSTGPVTAALYGENTSQIKTMEALLDLPSEFWHDLLDEPEATAPPPTTETVNKRQSVGSRVVGGSLQSQVLNPWTDNRRQKKRTLF